MHGNRKTDWQNLTVGGKLHRGVDFGLLGILFIAPLAMAGRYAGGRLLFVALVGVTAIVWALSRWLSHRPRCWQTTGVEILAAMALLLVLVQAVPMPSRIVHYFSPALVELLPFHHQSTGWQYISLVPQATRMGLAMTVAYVLLFAVVSQHLHHRRDIERLLKLIATAGIWMAAIGLLQRFLGNGKFLWMIEHPSRDTLTAVKGTFANENHFVHYLALTLGPLLWWIVKEHGETQKQQTADPRPVFATSTPQTRARIPRNQIFPVAGLVIVLLASLLSFSRGGLLMIMLAAVVAVALFDGQKRVGRQVIVALSAVIALAVLGVWLHGRDVLVRELDTLQTASIESLDEGHGRRKIWSAVLTAIPRFSVAGSGVGSHRYIYPTFFSDRSNVQYTHAESGYLQVMLETGTPGVVLLLLAVGLSGYWIVHCLRSERRSVAFLAVPLLASWSVSVTHAIFDFNWFIPANMGMSLIVAAAATRLYAMRRREEIDAKEPGAQRVNWAIATAGITVVVCLSAYQFVGPAQATPRYHEFRAWSLASNRFQARSIGPGRQRSLGFVNPAAPETTARMIQLLDESLAADPLHGRAHVRMAALCLRQFNLLQMESDLGMDLAQIRDAALSSEFSTHEKMVAWVMRVVGENGNYLLRVLDHAKRGVQLTPTEGQGYLYLAEVAFLDPALNGREPELMEQAYQVRPFDPAVQFVHGRYLLLAGQQERALELWAEAFRRGEAIRQRIIHSVGDLAPPEEIVSVFQPDVDGFKDLFDYYRLNGRESQMRLVGRLYVEQLEKHAPEATGSHAGQLWFDAQFVHATLGDAAFAARAARNAIRAEPASYRNHYACALRMRDLGLWDEAITQFRWCQKRRPENEELPRVIAQLRQIARQNTDRQY